MFVWFFFCRYSRPGSATAIFLRPQMEGTNVTTMVPQQYNSMCIKKIKITLKNDVYPGKVANWNPYRLIQLKDNRHIRWVYRHGGYGEGWFRSLAVRFPRTYRRHIVLNLVYERRFTGTAIKIEAVKDSCSVSKRYAMFHSCFSIRCTFSVWRE